jgi:ribonuclease D
MAEGIAGEIITTQAQLSGLVEHLRAIGRFALDTEFVSEDTFEPILCLLQLATRERLAVIDPLAVRDLGPLWDLVNRPSVEVVMHAAGEDLRICNQKTGKLPRRVFDVQIAAGLTGLSYPLSLVNLVSQVLGVSLSGSETRTDWRHRPLSAAQLNYALDDVRYLLDLADHFTARLEQLGRNAYAEAEFEDLVDSVARRAAEDRWRRLPGVHHLGRRCLEMARRLAEWREDEARRMNRPLRQILRDDLLVAIAKRQPTNRRGLEALRDFNRPALLNRSQEILAILEEAREVPEDQLPELAPRHEEPPGLSTITNLLSAALAQCCAQNQIAASMVSNVADLKELVSWYIEGRDESRRPALLEGWRNGFCGQLLLDVLEGRFALRVVEPGSEYPVAVEPVTPVAVEPVAPVAVDPVTPVAVEPVAPITVEPVAPVAPDRSTGRDERAE